jgi:GMP synthase (glutamine-hydrolysing)
MSELLVLKNATREGLGLMEDVLNWRHISYSVVDLEAGDPMPRISPTEYDALVVLGGPRSANNTDPTMRAEVDYVQETLEEEVPYLGVGLGMQVGVKAAGGEVQQGPLEVGFFDAYGQPFTVAATDEGLRDPLLAGMPREFPVFQLHNETVALAPNTELLGAGASCPNQLVQLGERAYGVQAHVEVTPAMLDVWAAEDPVLQGMDRVKMLGHLEQIGEDYDRVGRTLFTNFLRVAGLVRSE